jgi:hypothetical protein
MTPHVALAVIVLKLVALETAVTVRIHWPAVGR